MNGENCDEQSDGERQTDQRDECADHDREAAEQLRED
jgi:hypothetical protein